MLAANKGECTGPKRHFEGEAQRLPLVMIYSTPLGTIERRLISSICQRKCVASCGSLHLSPILDIFQCVAPRSHSDWRSYVVCKRVGNVKIELIKHWKKGNICDRTTSIYASTTTRCVHMACGWSFRYHCGLVPKLMRCWTSCNKRREVTSKFASVR